MVRDTSDHTIIKERLFSASSRVGASVNVSPIPQKPVTVRDQNEMNSKTLAVVGVVIAVIVVLGFFSKIALYRRMFK